MLTALLLVVLVFGGIGVGGDVRDVCGGGGGGGVRVRGGGGIRVRCCRCCGGLSVLVLAAIVFVFVLVMVGFLVVPVVMAFISASV